MSNKSKKILTEISAGELLDKISILEIKLEKIKDKNSQEEIKKEYKILKQIQNSSIKYEDRIKNFLFFIFIHKTEESCQIQIWPLNRIDVFNNIIFSFWSPIFKFFYNFFW